MYIRHLDVLCDVYSPEGHPFAAADATAAVDDSSVDADEDDLSRRYVPIINGVWCNVTTADKNDEYENFQAAAPPSKGPKNSVRSVSGVFGLCSSLHACVATYQDLSSCLPLVALYCFTCCSLLKGSCMRTSAFFLVRKSYKQTDVGIQSLGLVRKSRGTSLWRENGLNTVQKGPKPLENRFVGCSPLTS